MPYPAWYQSRFAAGAVPRAVRPDCHPRHPRQPGVDGNRQLPSGHLPRKSSWVQQFRRAVRREPEYLGCLMSVSGCSGSGTEGRAVLRRGVLSAAPAPYGFPLRPLAGLGRGAPGAVQPDRQDGREAAGEQLAEFGGAEEVDEQAPLGPGEVADGEPAVRIALGHLVLGPDVSPGRVDPQAEQPARGDPLLCGADVRAGAVAVPVLEDLDADDQRPGGTVGQRREVSADETVAAAWRTRGELADGGR